jgi:hypothetical protein
MFLNNVFIIQTKVPLPQVSVTLADIGYPVYPLWFYCSKNLILFDFPMFRFWAYLMKVIPGKRRTELISMF